MNKPKYIDIHSHLNFKAYDEDRDEVIKRTLESDTWTINVGTMQKTSQEAVDLAEKNEGVYAIIGLHPIHVNKSFHDKDEIGEEGKAFTSKGEEYDEEFYKNLAFHPKVVGIGECGLDFFRIEGSEEEIAQAKKRQLRAFGKQIDLAVAIDKPLMIHCRNAYRDVLDILRVYKSSYGARLRGNVHFFAGTKEEAKEFIQLGFTISFTGVITFAKEYEELVRDIPLESIMTETDCPYVTPEPHRGKRNEPIYVSEVVKKIAQIKGLDEEEVRVKLVENAIDFWGIKY